MKWQIVALTVLLFLLSEAVALEVNPPILEANGKNGDFILKSVELYNDRDTQATVNMSVVGITNYYLQKSTYTLNPYERKAVTIGFTVEGSQNGFITYEYGGTPITQYVYMNAEKSVILFPPEPKAGRNLAIQSFSNAEATGILFVDTGGMYMVNIDTAFTIINISKNDYGSAMLSLMWDDGDSDTIFFNISEGKGGGGSNNGGNNEPELEIDFNIGGAGEIRYGDTKIITLTLDGDGVNGEFMISKPSGGMLLKDTNSRGQIQLTFDEAGTWSFVATSDDETVSDIISINKKGITLDIPSDIQVGKSFDIDISEDEASFIIETPDNSEVDGDTDDGSISFIPEEAGKYDITVSTASGEGEDDFKAYYKPTVIFKNGFQQITGWQTLKKGKQYTVEVHDEKTSDIITDVESISVIGDLQLTIPLTNGRGVFQAPNTGSYSFVVDRDLANYIMEGSTDYTFTSSSSGGISALTIIGIGAVIAFIIIIVLYKIGKLPFIGKDAPSIGSS